MRRSVYIGLKKYAVYFKSVVEKTLEFLTLPARFISKKVQELKNYTVYGNSKQGDLPEGYTQLEYIESTGTQYIDTKIKVAELPKFEIEWSPNTEGSNYLCGVRIASNLFNGVMGSGAGETINSTLLRTTKDTTSMTFATIRTLNHWYKNISTTIAINNGYTSKYILEDLTNGISEELTSGVVLQKPFDIPTQQNIFLFAVNNSNIHPGVRIKSYKYYDSYLDSSPSHNLIPAKRNSDNVLGMYDTVTNTFLTNKGTGTFIAGAETTPSPTNPIEVESVGDRTKNIADLSSSVKDKYIDSQGVAQNGAYTGYSFAYTKYIKVKPDTTYSFTIIHNSKGEEVNHRVIGWTSNKTFIRQESNIVLSKTQVGAFTSTFTTSATTEYLTINYLYAYGDDMRDAEYVQLEEGDTATPYEQYGYKIPVKVNDTTTTNIYLSEPLRRIGNYVDYIDFESQKVVRNVKAGLISSDLLSDYDNQYKRWRSIAINDCVRMGGTRKIVGFADSFVWLSNEEPIGDIKDGSIYLGITAGVYKLYIHSLISDKTQFLNSLSELNIYYPLNTPTEETITLPAINLPQNIVTIDIDTNIKPSKLTITGDIDNE